MGASRRRDLAQASEAGARSAPAGRWTRFLGWVGSNGEIDDVLTAEELGVYQDLQVAHKWPVIQAQMVQLTLIWSAQLAAMCYCFEFEGGFRPRYVAVQVEWYIE